MEFFMVIWTIGMLFIDICMWNKDELNIKGGKIKCLFNEAWAYFIWLAFILTIFTLP